MNDAYDLSKTANSTKIRNSFEEDGFVLLPSFLSPTELSKVKKSVANLISNHVPKMPAKDVYYEVKSDVESLKQLQQLSQVEPYFHNLLFHSHFTKLATFLLGKKAIGKNLQYFNKPAKIGKGTPPHQDGFYFMLDKHAALTMWLALEDADEKNGCVRYIKGSHKLGLRAHRKTSVLGFSQGITDFGTAQDLQMEVSCPAKAGDLLIHHALTIHWAGPNTSVNHGRKALGLIYYAEDAKQDTEAHAAYAALLKNELLRDGKI